MSQVSDERAVFARFSKKYRLAQSDVWRAVERTVCGGDYGATSWTTIDEARAAGKLLALGPGKRLLDVGSGSGWPGLFLAKETGCDIALCDLPLTALRIAVDRAASDRISGVCFAAVADGAALPFRGGSFDAVLHADVLCCLKDKLGVLKSCRRAVRGDGKMVFSVIVTTPGLAAAEYERAAASGPPFIETDCSYTEMLGHAGWKVTEHRDLTPDYMSSMGKMVEMLAIHALDIEEIFGEDDASQERARRRATLAALEQGLLRRELFAAVPVLTAANGRSPSRARARAGRQARAADRGLRIE